MALATDQEKEKTNLSEAPVRNKSLEKVIRMRKS